MASTSKEAQALITQHPGELFKLLVDSIADYAIFLLDPQGFVLSWNKGAQAIKGYRAEEIIGKHFSVFYSEEQRISRHPDQELEAAARDGQYCEEGWRIRKDGSRFWASVLITSLRDQDTGELIAFAKITRDLTEKRHNIEQLENANRELEQANKTKDNFLANMSHELRTPLNSILGFNDVMLMGLAGPMTDVQMKQAGYIKRAAEHLLSLINDILDLAKVQSGNLQMRFVPVKICALVPDLVSGLKPLAEEKALFLDCRCDSDSLIAEGDERAIRQILTNLLSNAIKFTDHGGITIRCAVENDAIFIHVQDTGIGISQNDIGKLFKGFVQLVRADRKQEGTGLGLVLSKRLAECMRGDVLVTSELGNGSTFTLKLPALKA